MKGVVIAPAIATTSAAALAFFVWRRRNRRVPRWGREVRVACRLALQCGRAILETTTRETHWKNSIDPCTATDRNNERLVMDGIAKAFPDDLVVGEEACSETGVIPALRARTWIVDPVDGTQNFVHNLPCSVVSIALVVQGRPELGVVYDPHRDELYVAGRGRGSFLDGRRLHVSNATVDLASALVLTDPGYERGAGIERLVAFYRSLLRSNCRAVRVIGTSVLSLCWVAADRASAFVVGLAHGDSPKPWDWAAATLIASEAGATVAMIDERRTPPGDESKPPTWGPDFDLFSKSCVCAADRALANQLRHLALAAIRGGGGGASSS